MLAESIDDPDDVDNLIPQHDAAARRQMMDSITTLGLKHAEDKKISTTILGHEITVEKAIANTAGVVSWAEDYIKDAAKDLPYASIIIVGVSLVLPLLKNPVAAEEARSTGFTYVISQMRYYAAMEPFLISEDAKSNLEIQDQMTNNLTKDLAGHLSQLYESIIEFQVRSIIHLYRSRTKSFFRGTINYDDWKGRLASIKEAETALEAKFAASQSAQNLDTLKKMRHEAGESRKQLENMLSQMMQVLYDQLGVASRMDRRMESEEDRNCIKSLHASDSRDNKTRIESKKGGLLEDSYRWIFHNSSFQQWHSQPAQALLWIRGDPGKGKTMLVCAITDELIKSPSAYTSNVCYFFCEATLNQTNNASAVLRGLIYMLLKQQPELMTHLRELHDGIESRFEGENAWYALAKLFKQLATDPNLNKTYMLIDGLDECNTNLADLLDLVVELSTAGCSHIKWIVSSRNEAPMTEKLGTETSGDVQLSLELNAESVSVAVNAYIDYKVSMLHSSKGYSEHERLVIYNHLRETSNATFLWVALVCQRLAELNGKQALREIKKGIFPPGLDSLYKRMLQRIEDARTTETVDICKRTLAVVCTVYRPITLSALPSLIGLHEEFLSDDGVSYDFDALKAELSWCGSFFSVKEDVITIVHQSAADFLHKGAADRIFPQGIKQAHHMLFLQSLRALNRVLKKDIYGLVHPGYHIDAVEWPDPDPLAMVVYSARYWIDHLEESGAVSDAVSAEDRVQVEALIYQFMTTQYLYWLEALSLDYAIPSGIRAVAKLRELLSRSQFPQLTSTLRDADQFLRYFKVAIEIAPLQVYASALLFSPSKSITRKNFEHHSPGWVSLQPSPLEDWDGCIHTLEGHTGSIRHVQFCPDGKSTSSLSSHGTLRTWDIAKGVCTHIFPESDQMGVLQAFCGNIAAFQVRKRIQVWDIAANACIKVLEGSSARFVSLVLSPDGKRIAGCCVTRGDETVRIWDIAGNNTSPIQALEGFTTDVLSSVFSPDGQKLALATTHGIIRVWDIAASTCTQTIETYARSLSALAFSPDGKRIASVCGKNSRTLRMWDVATGDCMPTFYEHSDMIESIAFSPNCKIVASGCRDGTIRIWDLATNTCVQFLRGHTDDVTSMAFSSDGERIVTGSDDRTLRIWEVQPDTTAAVSRTAEKHKAPIMSVTLSPDKQRIAAVSHDKLIQIWDATTGAALHRLEESADMVYSVKFSPDGQKIASSATSSDGLIRIWDSVTGDCIQTLQGHRAQIEAVAVSPDGQQVTSAADKTIRIWNTINSSSSPSSSFCPSSPSDYEVEPFMSRLSEGGQNQITTVAFSPDGRKLVSGSFYDVRVWDATTGDCLQILKGHSREVDAVAFSPDGCKLASATYDDVRVWDVATGNSLVFKGDWHHSQAVAFSPDSLRLVSGSYINVRVWDTATGDELMVKESEPRARAVAFSPDGERLVASGPNGTIIWNVNTDADVDSDVVETTGADAAETIDARDGVTNAPTDSSTTSSKTSNQSYAGLKRIRGFSWPLSLGVLDIDAHEDQYCVEVAITTGRTLRDCIITVAGNWVLVDGRETLWLPGEYRASNTYVNTFAVAGSTLVLGCASGQVFLVRFR